MKYGNASRRICLVHCWVFSRSWGWWSGRAGSIAANTDGEDPLWIVDADRGRAVLSHVHLGAVDDVGVLPARHLGLDLLVEGALGHGEVALAHPGNANRISFRPEPVRRGA